MIRACLRYELRVPTFTSTTFAEQYAACLDQCAWADELGFDTVLLSEHHGIDDGYCPSPITLAAAIAGRAKRLSLFLSVVVLPMHNPVELAEQIVVLDLLTQGRLTMGIGLGYRAEELAMAGVSVKDRGKIAEEYLGVLRQAWTGKPFEWRGRTIRVTPKLQHPLRIIAGGYDKAAARRAARMRVGFYPGVIIPGVIETYHEECARLGFAGFVQPTGATAFLHVSKDPDRDWERVGPYLLYEARAYAQWQSQHESGGPESITLDMLRQNRACRVVTPEQCIQLMQGPSRVFFHPLVCGMPPALGWESLRLFEKEVVPYLR
jgi:alkanesulfonate monooxygenase SsuD/methylene tetrahydromethanopterin reductase-like flavin-dependent oxidoreductase (luciferase family)